MNLRSASRRRLLGTLGALGASAIGASASTRIVNEIAAPLEPGADLCSTPPRFDTPLRVPRHDGLMGRLAVGDRTLVSRAAPRGRNGMLAYAALAGGRQYVDPTLVVRTGTRLRVHLENGLDEPTSTHWHGLTVDSANDGNRERLAYAGGGFDYDFIIRNRAGLYWYHPHPHGATAAQLSRGLFDLLAVEDDEEIALRRDDGMSLPFHPIGTDGGLLEQQILFHCHNLEHEDGGMMLRVKVG